MRVRVLDATYRILRIPILVLQPLTGYAIMSIESEMRMYYGEIIYLDDTDEVDK